MQAVSSPISERRISLDGLHIDALAAGSGDLLILIHGSLCDYRYWRWQLPAFAARFHVIAPSLPGCWPNAVGNHQDELPVAALRQAAATDNRYSIDCHVRAMIQLCRHQAGDRPVYLLGHSRGAQVALEAALALGDTVAGLVLADPGFPFDDEPASTPVHAAIAEKLGLTPLDSVIGEFVDTVNGPDTWRRTVPWFKEMVRANAWTLLPQLKDIDRSVSAATLAQDLACPVLLVGGEHSPARYGSRMERLRTALPQAQQVTVPKAAHGMNLANARYFNNAVLNFLDVAAETAQR